ncbi:MAG: PHP domain-containing protein [Treponema sp.]|jgi:predicted metal-dependent phosphoesterase TrpH|nr:PHP domain-containing protein [Treponema sp.]
MKNYIDLHIHSIHSGDGEFTPEVLVRKCEEANIKIMAIADHNTISGIEEEKIYCKKMRIICIPAVEIDCIFNNINLHVIGYGIDYTKEEIIALEKNVFEQELSKSKERLELTNALGFELKEDELRAVRNSDIWTGELFGEILLSKEAYKDHEILKPYRKGGERSDNPYANFFWDFYGQGKPCYTEIKYPSLDTIIKIVHKYGGAAVLAHPGNNLKNKYGLFDDMVSLGLDGVEAFSSYHSLEEINYFYRKGKEKNLLITCGSDYHGKTKPAIAIGDSKCTIDQDSIEKQLKEYGLL